MLLAGSRCSVLQAAARLRVATNSENKNQGLKWVAEDAVAAEDLGAKAGCAAEEEQKLAQVTALRSPLPGSLWATPLNLQLAACFKEVAAVSTCPFKSASTSW